MPGRTNDCAKVLIFAEICKIRSHQQFLFVKQLNGGFFDCVHWVEHMVAWYRESISYFSMQKSHSLPELELTLLGSTFRVALMALGIGGWPELGESW